jgi:acyl carrier protein
MSTPNLKTEIRTFIEDNFLYLRPDTQLSDTDSLLELGVVDSLGFVELVEEVQSRYGVVVGDEDITEAHFGSIAAIAAYVEARTPAGAVDSARSAT